jgi:hypothetical protein
MNCSPRKAAAGAMIMPARAGKPSRTRFKMGGGNFPDLTGDGKVTRKDVLKGRGVPGFKYGGSNKKMK